MKPFDVLFRVSCSLLLSAAAACSPDDDLLPANTAGGQMENPSGGSEPGGSGAAAGLTVAVGGRHFAATLEENAAAQAFAALLPLTLEMEELNGNEKYCYLGSSLPAAASPAGTIRAGDLMLWGSDCVVLFYETFPSPYSYTRLGRVDDPSGLAAAVGQGGVTVEFSR